MADLQDSLNLFARRFVLALQSSTRLRAAGAAPPPPDFDAGRAALPHVPGVGWLVGITACLVFAVVSVALRGNGWAPLVAAVASTMATVWLTASLHETALHRFADHAGTRDAAAPRSGHGALALVLVLAGKLVLLATLAQASEPAVMAALFAGHVLSRFLLVVTDWAAATDGDTRALRTGALWCVVPLLLMVPAAGVAFLLSALVAAGLACFAALRYCRGRPDLPTTERPAMVQQVSELAFYFGAAIAL